MVRMMSFTPHTFRSRTTLRVSCYRISASKLVDSDFVVDKRDILRGSVVFLNVVRSEWARALGVDNFSLAFRRVERRQSHVRRPILLFFCTNGLVNEKLNSGCSTQLGPVFTLGDGCRCRTSSQAPRTL